VCYNYFIIIQEGVLFFMGSFEPVGIGHRDRISRYLDLYPSNQASEYTFTNLFIWGGAEHIEFMETERFLLLRSWPKGILHYLMAFAEDSALEEALDAAIASAKAAGQRFSMHSLPLWYCDKLRTIMPGRFRITREDRLDDYVYASDDLINLRGKIYQAKRNHINRFMSIYGRRHEYAKYDISMADDCMMIYDEWMSAHEITDELRGERDSVFRALYHANELAAVGGVILVDGRPEAFSMGERLTDDMAVIHIEKANPRIPELFSLINREFVSHEFSAYAWINREEDMGNEGLRRAKQSYHPAMMIEKYNAVLTEDL